MTSQKQNDPRIVIISGYSGCGKGTVISRLMEKYGNYAFSVSMTTRDPRDNEIDGVHYHFVTNERFEKMISEAGFLEYAGYTDNYCGTPAAFVHENLAAGRDVLLDIADPGKNTGSHPDLCFHPYGGGAGEQAGQPGDRDPGQGLQTSETGRGGVHRDLAL